MNTEQFPGESFFSDAYATQVLWQKTVLRWREVKLRTVTGNSLKDSKEQERGLDIEILTAYKCQLDAKSEQNASKQMKK